jgi:hypothetical protein
MKLAAAHQPPGDFGRLQQRALGREVGSQIPCDGNQDMPALVAVAPLAKLPHTRLEHQASSAQADRVEKRIVQDRDE